MVAVLLKARAADSSDCAPVRPTSVRPTSASCSANASSPAARPTPQSSTSCPQRSVIPVSSGRFMSQSSSLSLSSIPSANNSSSAACSSSSRRRFRRWPAYHAATPAPTSNVGSRRIVNDASVSRIAAWLAGERAIRLGKRAASDGAGRLLESSANFWATSAPAACRGNKRQASRGFLPLGFSRWVPSRLVFDVACRILDVSD